MDTKSEHILSYFYRSTRIPVSYYAASGCIRSYVPIAFQPDIAFCYLADAIEKRTDTVGYAFHHGMHMGYVILSSQEYLLIGPVCAEAVTHEQCRHLLDEIHVSLTKARDLKYFLNKIPAMNRSRFLNTLQLLNYLSGNEDVQRIEDVSANDILKEPLELTSRERENSELEYHDTQEVEEKLMAVIASGRVDELLQTMIPLTNAALNPGKTAGNSLRMTKNTFISAAAIVSRIAIHEGLDYDLSLTLSDYYIQKIETFTRMEDIIPVLGQMMLDYCQRIHKLRSFENASPITVKAIDYIERHLCGQCRLEEIAVALGISVSYLSATFKRDTGISLKQYIQREKINRAKYLLESSDASVSEIAEQLGYSCISHFQSGFKKIAGITPGQYRKHHRFV